MSIFEKIKNYFVSPEKFYGHRLDQWDYIGIVEPHFVMDYDPKETPTRTSVVFLFQNKVTKKRSYHAQFASSYDENLFRKNHKFFKVSLPEWLIEERDIYELVEKPSKALLEIMKERGYVWSTDKDWWIRDTPIEKDGNVLIVDFKK